MTEPEAMALTPFERAMVAHLVADWLLQNNWMAAHKSDLRHPAAWVHGAIHAICLALALGPRAGLCLGLVHILIDTRLPLAWWTRVFKGNGSGTEAMNVAIWADQVLHVVTIALWISFVPN